MTEPIRVLHIVEAALGGVRRYLENVVEAMPRGTIEPGLVFSGARMDAGFERLLETCRAAGWFVEELPMVRSIHPRRDVRAIVEARRVVRRFGPHVIHAHSSKAGAVGRIAAHTLGRARPVTVFSPHASAVHLGGMAARIERGLSPLSDLVGVISPSERDEVIRDGLVSRDRVHVIPPVIDVARFSPGPTAPPPVEEGGPVVLGVGRLCEQKDPLIFAAAIGHLRQRWPGLRALWVGDGELRDEVCARGVTVTGWVDDVVPYLRGAHVLLMTSRYESFGYATAEAMAAGVPVVATAVAGSVDLVSDDRGRLVPAGDPVAVADAAAELLASDDRRRRAGLAARDFVHRTFTPEKMRACLTSLYDRARSLSTAERSVVHQLEVGS